MKTVEKPFSVALLIRQKHGVLYRAIREKGWTQREAARYLGISEQSLGKIINLKEAPPSFSRMGKKGARKRDLFFAKMALLTGKSVEELFPEEVYNDEVMAQAKPLEFYIERDVSTLKLGGSEQLRIEEFKHTSQYDEPIAIMRRYLTPTQWKMVEMHYLQGMSFQDIGQKEGVTNSRVQTVVRRALRRLASHKHILGMLRGSEDIELNRALGVARVEALSARAPSNVSSER